MKLRKGDRVRVLSGKDRGKEGVIMSVLADRGRVIVEGVNLAKRHQRPTRMTMQGGIIDKDMPIEASNVAIVCPSCGPTRIGYRFDRTAKGKPSRAKFRVCRKCGGDV